MGDTCKYCRERIRWGLDSAGRRIPLDVDGSVFRVVGSDYGSDAFKIEPAPTRFTTGAEEVVLAEHRCIGALRSRGARRRRRTPR